MTLKEELEILRGEPIQVFDGDPMDIPCIETSDPQRLCKNPVVSVHMMTYNHEPYIRQAIEGVMMQKTDFEFELIIGEDCSQDKTREICFEYQKKYPDKIRVLWWHENVSKLGGNGRRVSARCRGEFIALCEGDDYWIDPLKLQKQVDVMRKHHNVGLCFARAKIQALTKSAIWNENGTYPYGLITGREFVLKHLFGVRFNEGSWPSSTFLMTASVLFRKSTYDLIREKYDIFKWKLFLGDTTLWLGLASVSDAYCLEDIVSVYNQNSTGLCVRVGNKVGRDATIVRLYYFTQYFKKSFACLPNSMLCTVYYKLMIEDYKKRQGISFRKYVLECHKLPHYSAVIWNKTLWPVTMILWLLDRADDRIYGRYAAYWLDNNKDPAWIRREYKKLGVKYRSGARSSVITRVISGIVNKCAHKAKR